MWNCVEVEVKGKLKYGRIMRKIIFGNIFLDDDQIEGKKPISYTELSQLEVSFKTIITNSRI